jgi:uncharacterized protein (TIGR00251 family)
VKTPATPRPEGVLLPLRVQPRASRDEIVGWQNGALRVRVTAPPVDGAANAAISALLAGTLRVPPSSISVVRGTRGRDKLVRITGLAAAAVKSRLGASEPPELPRLAPGSQTAKAGTGERSRLASRVARASGAGSHLSQATLGPSRPPRTPLE